MPLLDHFRPPLSDDHCWRSFHFTWSVYLAEWLNRNLPGCFRADASGVGDDTFHIDIPTRSPPDSIRRGAPTAIRPWFGPPPALSTALAIPGQTEAEVLVLATDEGDRRVVAAIELLSERSKDRPIARQALATKCAHFLRRGASVVVFDAVTVRRIGVHEMIVSMLGVEPSDRVPAGMSVVAYQNRRLIGVAPELRVWPAALEVGARLPTVPLWIEPDLALPLDLEPSYRTTCEGKDIPQDG